MQIKQFKLAHNLSSVLCEVFAEQEDTLQSLILQIKHDNPQLKSMFSLQRMESKMMVGKHTQESV